MPIRAVPALTPLIALVASLTAHDAAADTALLLVNDRYDNAQNLRDGRDIERLRDPLEAAGFEVITVADGGGAELRDGLGALLRADETERVFIAALGHFAHSDGDGWILGSGTDAPTLASVGGDGLSLSVLLEVAARAPGRAVVMLAEEGRRMALGAGLATGIGALDVPQGVTVLTGAPDDLADFATDSVLVPGADLADALDRARRVQGFGFVPSGVPFIGVEVATTTPVQPAAPTLAQPGFEETSLWNAATELDSIGAYDAYISRYPDGFYAEEARARIAAEQDAEAEAAPDNLALAIEEAIGLSRSQRQQIQRGLTILGYNTRGIDGIFGTGTRTAIQGWQSANGYTPTGYLDPAQVDALGDQAALRTAELEEEARMAREAEERADRAYWQVTGQGATEDGLRSYLDRYPDGLYADEAEARLGDFDRTARAEGDARDRAAWDVARGSDTIAALRDYLEQYPNGAFAAQANDRIERLQGGGNGQNGQETARLEANEAALNLPPITLSLMEQRLAALGLEPGRVDGRFDGDTRQAIRRYQQSRGLGATGYLDQITIVRLLAESVGGFLQLQ